MNKTSTETPRTSELVPRKILLPFILLTSCFAWWGLANNIKDSLLAALHILAGGLLILETTCNPYIILTKMK